MLRPFGFHSFYLKDERAILVYVRKVISFIKTKLIIDTFSMKENLFFLITFIRKRLLALKIKGVHLHRFLFCEKYRL